MSAETTQEKIARLRAARLSAKVKEAAAPKPTQAQIDRALHRLIHEAFPEFAGYLRAKGIDLNGRRIK